ncbi:MAG: hypothetical protein ACYS8W_05820 [Planctomycetota bacterium]|jgi:hypothetical protein
MKSLLKKRVQFLILLFIHVLAGSTAGGQRWELERPPVTIEDEIEIAKTIAEIKKLDTRKDRLKIKLLLNDSRYIIRRIVAWKIMFSDDEALLKHLQARKEDGLMLSGRAGLMLADRKNMKPREFRRKILEFLENNVNELAQEAVYIIINEGWVEYVSGKGEVYPKLAKMLEYNPEVVYAGMKKETANLPPEERKKLLISSLTGWKTVLEYEATIRLLSEMGSEIIPEILKLLDDPKNIPVKEAPPFERVHTNYTIILILLKSAPDNRSVTKLKELAENRIKYVSKEAKETLQWVESGEAYPFEYRRAMLEDYCDKIVHMSENKPEPKPEPKAAYAMLMITGSACLIILMLIMFKRKKRKSGLAINR